MNAFAKRIPEPAPSPIVGESLFYSASFSAWHGVWLTVSSQHRFNKYLALTMFWEYRGEGHEVPVLVGVDKQ